jgi:1,4-dihydroxy-2-naphthoyl-CoA hydrolase
VGLDINSNHIRAVREGWVYARATALHIGKTTQVWEIKITNEAGKLVNISRLTMAILPIEN